MFPVWKFVLILEHSHMHSEIILRMELEFQQEIRSYFICILDAVMLQDIFNVSAFSLQPITRNQVVIVTVESKCHSHFRFWSTSDLVLDTFNLHTQRQKESLPHTF